MADFFDFSEFLPAAGSGGAAQKKAPAPPGTSCAKGAGAAAAPRPAWSITAATATAASAEPQSPHCSAKERAALIDPTKAAFEAEGLPDVEAPASHDAAHDGAAEAPSTTQPEDAAEAEDVWLVECSTAASNQQQCAAPACLRKQSSHRRATPPSPVAALQRAASGAFTAPGRVRASLAGSVRRLRGRFGRLGCTARPAVID